MYMQCPKCGKDNNITDTYCGKCGAELPKNADYTAAFGLFKFLSLANLFTIVPYFGLALLSIGIIDGIASIDNSYGSGFSIPKILMVVYIVISALFAGNACLTNSENEEEISAVMTTNVFLIILLVGLFIITYGMI